MGPILLLLTVISSSLVITRIGTSALVLTGMSRDSARFQSLSAFMGVGFTTSESESIVGHPVRRRIVMLLMLLGNVGIASVVASMILTISEGNTQTSGLVRFSWFLAGLALLFVISKNAWLNKQFSSIIEWALRKWTHLEVTDYVALLQFAKGYSVFESTVSPGHWMGGQSLHKLALSLEGIMVLGIQRSDGTYIGTPTGTTVIHVHDTLTLYGRQDRLAELNSRRVGVAGAYAHARAMQEHRRELDEQRQDENQQRSGNDETASNVDLPGVSLESGLDNVDHQPI